MLDGTIEGRQLQPSVRRFFQNITGSIARYALGQTGGDILEVRINKEVRDYQESLFFGLSLRQFLFALLAVAVAVGVYFGLRDLAGTGETGWLCVLAACPFAVCGFFTYNGMTFERFLIAVIRSELLYPRHLVFKSDNLYAKLMEHTSMKEDLKLD